MHLKLKTTLGVAALFVSTLAAAQLTFYENDGYRGRTFATSTQVSNFTQNGYNDRASSVIVDRGRWEVCEDSNYRGRCVVLVPGNYDSLSSIGMSNRISSVRPAGQNTDFDVATPTQAPVYEYRRRPNDRILEVPVKTVRAVVGQPTERCWIERQQVSNPQRNEPNVGGAIAGALLGGILGHQVGGGIGKDIATVGGAVAGGAIGSKVGRNDNNTTERDVRRCETTANQTPAYWDVTYDYRGVEHRVQMTTEPGKRIAINQKGEPRL